MVRRRDSVIVEHRHATGALDESPPTLYGSATMSLFVTCTNVDRRAFREDSREQYEQSEY
ncbi:hypothetical protein BBOU_1069 [Bifidobacterium boum]|uniref:Uncharacterized protein n=1 Tax=Bifidobacterium boum TaxID=78343 RepID=A0A086ZKP7_9BIFI|nr:hypothetical protein BBOU_1069 [Bifidobacterium boum]